MKKYDLFTGKDIHHSNIDILQPVTIDELFKLITEPDPGLLKLSFELSKIITIDEQAYHKLKTKLPYFIGASFRNNLRNINNFEEINWFIIDLDKCFKTLEKELEMKEMFKNDNRVAMMFTSPSNQGLKLVFNLEKPIIDSSLYTNFYKTFTSQLAHHYKLEKYIDFKTSDVTRVCFINADANAWINKKAITVDWENYISPYDVINGNNEPENNSNNINSTDKNLSEKVYTSILKKLNPKTPKREKIIFVPDTLNTIVQPISNYSRKMGLPVSDVIDIHYGKKFVFRNGGDFAEINVFYGKNGFTVIITPKKGHNPTMSEAAKTIIEEVLFNTNSTNTDTNNRKIVSPGKIIKNPPLN